jgi:LmbE family N-acetylglucosaminyl deacetylase
MNHVRRVLCLSPHTDDAELGCGGTLARLAESGATIFAAVFSTCAESLPPGSPADRLKRECLAALPVLGVNPGQIAIYDFPVRRLADHRQEILEELVRLRREIDPDLVLLPAESDLHQDHVVVHAEGIRAFKERTVLGYELPWNHLTFAPTTLVRLERRHIERKWEACSAYRTQVELRRHYFAPAFVESLARVRGAQIKADWAEAFQAVRWVW